MQDESEKTSKTIDLGRKYGPEIMAKPSTEKKSYPSLYVDGLSKDSPLLKKDVGDTCEADVELKVVSKSQNSDGKWSINLEARTLKLY